MYYMYHMNKRKKETQNPSLRADEKRFRQKTFYCGQPNGQFFYTQLGSTQCIAFDKEYFLSFWHLLHPLLAIVYYTNWLALNMLVVLILHLAWGSSYLQDDPSSPFFIPWSTFFLWHDFGGFHLHHNVQNSIWLKKNRASDNQGKFHSFLMCRI